MSAKDTTELEIVDSTVENESEPITTNSMEVWKVSEFTEKVNQHFKDIHNVDIKVTLNTLNNYFRQLESQEIHFLNRINSMKVYNMQDLKVAEFIIIKRTKALNNGIVWQIPQIIDSLATTDLVRSKEKANEDLKSEQQGIPIEALNEFKEQLEQLFASEIAKLKEQNRLLIETQKEKEKTQVRDTTLEILALQKKFRLTAIDEWEKKDAKERFEGWLFKRERVSERDRFIEGYISDKLIEHLNDNLNDSINVNETSDINNEDKS